jgi:cathepsin X
MWTKPAAGHAVAEHVLTVRPQDQNIVAPSTVDYRSVDGKNLLSMSRNQHIPHYCGGCWAFAATATVADRLRIKTAGTDMVKINLAPQVLLNCDMKAGGCSGGYPLSAFAYMHTNGIVDESCARYEANGHDTGRKCEPIDICKNCLGAGSANNSCVAQPSFTKYSIEEYGLVNGTANMMAEIAARGPIVCGMDVTAALEAFSGPGVFVDSTGAHSMDHAGSLRARACGGRTEVTHPLLLSQCVKVLSPSHRSRHL